MPDEWYDQQPFDLRLDWGPVGVERAARRGDAIVIVDVLSFSTAAVVACARNATLIPCTYGTDPADLAQEHGAEVATKRGEGGYSLSPASLRDAPGGLRLVLPSPNGSTCAVAAKNASPVYFGALVNAGAVADALGDTRPVTVVAGGERWPGGGLRVAAEDLLGAGAVLAALPGEHSPEAFSAVSLYFAAENDLERYVTLTGSGIELAEGGFTEDVALASQLDAYSVVPELVDGVIRRRG